jgi:hypothetical protein
MTAELPKAFFLQRLRGLPETLLSPRGNPPKASRLVE